MVGKIVNRKSIVVSDGGEVYIGGTFWVYPSYESKAKSYELKTVEKTKTYSALDGSLLETSAVKLNGTWLPEQWTITGL